MKNLQINDVILVYKRPEPPKYDITESCTIAIVKNLSEKEIIAVDINKKEHKYGLQQDLPISILNFKDVKKILGKKMYDKLVDLQKYLTAQENDIFETPL